MEIKEPKITCSDGHFGQITFSITGPPDLVRAIVNFIRNLSKMHGGKY